MNKPTMQEVLVGPDDPEIVACEAQIREAQLAADVAALDRLIAEDLVFTGPDGRLATKADDLAAHRSGVVRFREHVPEELVVRRAGTDVAVAALRARLAVEVAGVLRRGTFRYTRVWAREGGSWRVVGGHVSEVPAETEIAGPELTMTSQMPETPRLRLSPFTPQHLLTLIEEPDRFEERFGLPAADGLRTFFVSGDLSPAWLSMLRAAHSADEWRFGFAVIHQESRQVIGTASFKGPPDQDRVVEIAYGIVPSFQGLGYATEAAEALVALAFRDDRVSTVRAHTLPEANASTRVLAKCGFAFVGEVVDPEDGPVWRWERAGQRGHDVLMRFDLPQTLDLLARTPTVLEALLRGTASSWHAVNEGAETWSAFDIVGHLIHGEETDWVPRARIILDDGESRAFEPFDRFAQLNRFAGSALGELLDRFAELRHANLATVRGWELTGAQLALAGRHPELGAVTLQQLLATWAVHDLNHIAQIARVMAKRYTEEAGPWRAYLSILNR